MICASSIRARSRPSVSSSKNSIRAVRGAWWQGYANAEVEAAIDAGRAEPDQVRRAGHYARAWRIMQQDPPWLTLYNPRCVSSGLPDITPPTGPRGTGVVDYGALPAAERSRGGSRVSSPRALKRTRWASGPCGLPGHAR